MTELYHEAEVVLDTFLFDDIVNNQNYSESTWDITWAGENFLLLHRETGRVVNIKVKMEPGDLTEEEIKQLGDDQEWFD